MSTYGLCGCWATLGCWLLLSATVWGQPTVVAQDPPAPQSHDKAPAGAINDEAAASDAAAVGGGQPGKGELKRLSRTEHVWIDARRKLVVADGVVVLREGLLEMFACPEGTKEHESILAVKGKASTIHAGLLAVGAKPGHPARFAPKYEAASGDPIEVLILWTDPDGKRHIDRAQSWVRRFKTNKELEHEWVFAGSSFWTDPKSQVRYYQGDAGDFICVSNFPTATMDLPISSSQSNDELLYEAFTEHIPPTGTPVRLVLRKRSAAKRQ